MNVPSDQPAGDFLLFVYGTLMRGGPRSVVLADQSFLAEACTVPGYALYHLGPYPGLLRETGASGVRGELFSIRAALRGLLDRIEGAPRLYGLERIELLGVSEAVYAYLYRGDVRAAPRIEDGRWDNARAAPWNGSELR
jgi:gamma-glutamylcyclotransferase (GGCT)/AIG2-like uncharacterized protein YtfP